MASPSGDLEALRARLAGALAQLRDEISAAEAWLRGPGAVPPVGSVPPAQPRLISPAGPSLAAPPAGTPVFGDVDQVVAPQPITDKSETYDLGRYYDFWIISPSIDARISLKAAVSQNTPAVPKKAFYRAAYRTRTVYYQAANPGESGTLSIWMAGI